MNNVIDIGKWIEFLLIKNLWMIIGAFGLSFVITIILIPIIIKLAKRFQLMDKPNQRKVHKNPIPTLGGIAIWMGTLLSFLIFTGFAFDYEILVLLAAISILFITGIIDDLKEISALKRLLIQVFSASIVFMAGFRFDSLMGLFGVFEIPYLIQYLMTVFWVILIVNAINLIDGIDGLAGGLSLTASIVLAGFLWMKSDVIFALFAFALSASLLAFLKYNFNPAKIFMGDTGSVIIGFLLAIFILRVMNGSSNSSTLIPNSIMIKVSFSVILVPVYDAIRVSLLRIKNKTSPFSADKTHIHHLLLKTGFNHKRSAVILYISNALVICSAFLFSHLSIAVFILFIVCEAVFLTELLNLKRILNLKIRDKKLTKEFKVIEKNNYLLSKQLSNV